MDLEGRMSAVVAKEMFCSDLPSRQNFLFRARTAVCYLPPAATAFRLHISFLAITMLFLGSPHQWLTPAEVPGLGYFHATLGSPHGKSLLWISPLDSLRNFQIHIAVGGSPCPILLLLVFLLTGKGAYHGLELSLLNPTTIFFYLLKALPIKKPFVFPSPSQHLLPRGPS